MLDEESLIPSNQYIHVAALCAIVWDIVIHISQDTELFMGSKLSLASSTFLLSRISTLLQAIASVMFTFGIVPACRLNPIETSLFVISICSTTLLFVFRARAVFLGSRRATVFFFACWMIVVCNCFTMPFSFTAVRGPGEGCTIRAMETYCVSCFVTAAMNDIAVFVLITWKILSFFAAGEGYKSCFAYFWGRDNLPMIPDILLRTGQQYVLLTVTVKALGTALMHTPHLPYTFRTCLNVPLAVVENAMGCKVFRDIRLDLAERDRNWSAIPSEPIQFAQGKQPLVTWAMEESLLQAI